VIADRDLAGAIRAWREALKPDQVDDAPETIARYSQTTQSWNTQPACVLYPRSTEDVQAIVRVANDYRAPIYPISRGRNWGYGERCAPASGMAICDLSRMDRIHEIHEEMAYCVVEPGVTQGQLHDRLDGAMLWMDSTGAGPEASVMGNTMERGFGHTRYGDHVRTVCGFEVVLANGEILRTGYGHFGNAVAERTYPYGLGPDLHGLFFQSNFGIVTKMGLWLMPAPEDFTFFYSVVEEDHGLEGMVDALRPLRMQGFLNTTLHIGNDIRLFSGRAGYPWDAAGGQTPLPRDLRMKMRKDLGSGAWSLGGSLAGPRVMVRGMKRELRRSFAHVGKMRFLDDGKLALLERALPFLPGNLRRTAQAQLDVLKPNYGLLKGRPTRETLKGAHWRNRPTDRTAPPEETSCGLMWIAPVLPLRGRDAMTVATMAEEILSRYGFEPLMTFTLINERSMVCIVQVSYDRGSEEEGQRATACYQEFNAALAEKGYYPYRAAAAGVTRYHDPNDPYWQTLAAMKRTLDPNNILAPGRYVPDWQDD